MPFSRLLARGAVLLALPLALVFLCLAMSRALGPYWIGANSDPSYQYLFSSLRLTCLHSTSYVDHPGMPLQLGMAGIILARELPQLPEGREVLQEHVIAHSEEILRLTRHALTGLLALALAIGGWLVAREGGLVCGLLFQTTPFLAPILYDQEATVNPEPMVIVFVTLLAAALYLLNQARTEEERLRYSLGSGVCVGLVLSTKISCFPLLAVPLLMAPSWRLRGMGGFAAAGVFLLTVLPVLDQTGAFFRGLRVHGGDNLSLAGYLANLRDLWDIARELRYVMTADAVLLLLAFLPGAFPGDRAAAERRALAILMAAAALQFLLVAKKPVAHYLVPAAALLGLHLVLIFQILMRSRLRGLPASLLVVAGIAGLALPASKEWRHSLLKIWNEQAIQREFYSHIQQLPPDALKVTYYRCSDMAFALDFGNRTVGSQFAKPLKKLYPEFYCLNMATPGYRNFDGDLTLADITAKHRPIYFTGTSFSHAGYDAYVPPGLVLEEVSFVGGFSVYRVKEILPDPGAPGVILPLPVPH